MKKLIKIGVQGRFDIVPGWPSIGFPAKAAGLLTYG
jgi:hypothetical protein